MNHAGDQSMVMRGPKRMQVQKTIWRPVDAHARSPEGHKKMKVHKSIWRPINAQSQKPEGKGTEDMATCIRNGEREYTSVTNTKSGISINDCEDLPGGKIASISGVETTVTSISGSQTSAASISGLQTSSQYFQPDSETTSDLGLRTKPIKSFISVKHVKSEAAVKCIATKEQGTLDPITMVDLDDASKCEQTDTLSESKASVLSINKKEGSLNSSTTDNEKDPMEDQHQQGDKDKDVRIQKTFINIEESVKRYSSTVKVDTALLRFVKGKGGKVQQKIEDTTGVKLSFISTEEESSVVLDGPSTESLSAAATMIQKVLDEAVKGPNLPYSHFISLPLAIHSELKEKLTSFQNSILALSGFPDSETASTVESSDEDSENVYEGKKVAVNLNVEENNKHVKVELEIPVKNAFSQKESSIPVVETTHAHPADEISDVKEAVAVKLDVEDRHIHVNLDVKGNSVRNTQVKRKAFCSQAKKNLGIDKSIFIKPATFHLTVLMLKLWNKERVAAAAEVLVKVSTQVKDALEGRPLAVNLEGLELMRGNPAKAHVLYAPVKEVGSGDRLLRACRVIIDAFVEAGLVMHKDATSTLKLHATLMNTSHRKKKFGRYRSSFPFDARQILELYGSENWGEYVIPEVHLSQRFKYDNNGYYHCCASIPFPEIGKGIGDATADFTKEMDEMTTQNIAEVTNKEIGGETAETNKVIGEVPANETDE